MRWIGLVAMVLMLGCFEMRVVDDDDRGICVLWDMGQRRTVPCSWCRQGAGMVHGYACYWEPDE